MAIDLHAHWTPRGLAQASAAGRDWYGWRVFRDPQGGEYVAQGRNVLAFAASRSTLEDPAARARARAGNDRVDFEALVLTGTFWNYHLDASAAQRFTREVNEEIAEVQKAYPDRFHGIAVLPMQHPALALAELDYAVGRLGLTSIVIASNVRGMNLDEPAVLPVIEAAARAGVSITVHPVIWGKAGEDRLPRYSFWNSFGAPLESSLAAMSLVYSGLLDRVPEARLMFTQGGGWIHFGVGRLDLRYRQRADARPMAAPPADYLRRMYFDCLVHDDASFALLKTRAGADQILIGTDFPAGGDIIGGAVRWIESHPALTPAEREAILWRNAERFLGKRLPAHRAIA